MFGLGGIISGLANLGGSVLNSRTAERIANRQMVFNSEEAQKSREWNERMYNQYNSPIAQVQQYKLAGLNPNLLYGNGASIPPVQSSAMANAGTLPVSRPGDALSGSVNSALGASLMEAQIENIKADTSKKKSETTGIDIENDVNSRSADFRVQLISMLPVTESEKQGLISQQRKESIFRSEQIKEFVDKIMPLQEKQIGATIRNLDAATLKALEEKKYISYNAKTARLSADASVLQAKTASQRVNLEFQLLPYQIKLLQSQCGLNDAQSGLLYKQGIKVLNDASLSLKQGKLVDLQAIGKRFENDWNVRTGLSNDHISSSIKYFLYSLANLFVGHSSVSGSSYDFYPGSDD